MKSRLTARVRYVLAALLAAAAIFSGLQVSHVESNMQRVTDRFDADRTPH